MKEKLSFSPQDIATLARSLAEIELLRARQLAWNLPAASSLEEHCRIGLGIGAAGRRIKILLGAAGERVLSEIAPSPCEEWQELGSAINSGPSTGPDSTHESLYQAVLQCIEPLGIMAYEFKTALQTCCWLRTENNVELPAPLRGSAKTMVKALLDLGTTRGGRLIQISTRMRRGNTRKTYDPRWQLLPVGSPLPRMKRVDIRAGLIHKLHHTAFRETAASEVAALNLLEYDGLPWEFYTDMAQQSEDEARHALLAAARLEALGGRIGQFPIAYLGNFYHMFWEMTLPERLVAMNLDTEAIGQLYLADIAERLEIIGDGETAILYEFVRCDERRHAQFGAKWFKYLYPENASRREALEAARALTAVNLASGCVQILGGCVMDTIDRWLEGEKIINFEEPATEMHAQEISLLTARRRAYRLNKTAAKASERRASAGVPNPTERLAGQP